MTINGSQTNGIEFGYAINQVTSQPGYGVAIDYVGIALSRLTSQFDKSPMVRAFVQAMVSPLVSFESDANDLREKRWIDTAKGVQLDGCGAIVGVLRQGRGDEEYRSAIKFQVFVNTSNATPEEMMTGLRTLTMPDDVQYIEQYPATAIFFTDGVSTPTNIKHVMQSLAPAAISDVNVLVSYAGKPFRFAKSPPPAELFVNNDADYLTIDGSDWTLAAEGTISGSTLGGLAATDFSVNGSFFMGLDDGSELVFNDPNSSTMIESGYHLTGVY